MCKYRETMLKIALIFLLKLIHSYGISNYEGYSSTGKGELSVSNYNEFNKDLCQPSVISFNELTGFGKAEVIRFKCPEGYQITGVEYFTDSLELFITGIRFICNDSNSSFYMGSENFNSKNIKGKYSNGGINEVAFGYDVETPILRLIQVVKEEALPKGSEKLLSFISPVEQLFRSQTFVGSIPTSVCGVLIKNSSYIAPIIGNIRVEFLEKRPLSQHKYRGLVYTGTPEIDFLKPDFQRCNQISGASPSNTKDLNFHIKCPNNHRIIGIDAIMGDQITAVSLESVSNQLNKFNKQSSVLKPDETEFKDESTSFSDSFIDSLSSSSKESIGMDLNNKDNDIDSAVNNGEIIMFRFLCSDYITSFSIGQALKNITSWNLQDQIPNVKDWEVTSSLVNDEAEKNMRDAAEQKLVLGTAEVRLGNVNSILIGYTTEKLLVKAYLNDAKQKESKHEIAENVERFTFGPVFINVNEFVDNDFKRRNILKLLPEIYKSNPINSRLSFSGDKFEGLCGRIMYGSLLISSIGFEVSKSIKPHFPQIITTSSVKIEKRNGESFGCDKMLKPTEITQENKFGKHNLESIEARSSLRSFQGSIECPPGLAVERIQLLINNISGKLTSIKFDCGNDSENYFIIGEAKSFQEKIKSHQKGEAIKENNYEIINTVVPKSSVSYDEIKSILVSPSKNFSSNSIFIPEANLPISMFQVIQKNDISPKQLESRENKSNYISERYPPNDQRKKIWNNGVLTKVCVDITSGGAINNIGFGFKFPFQPTSRKEISSYYGFSSEGNGELDVDSKEFICPGMLHSPRAQLLFSKQTEEIIMTGELRSRSKKTLLRSVNFRCPEKSVINRVEVAWQIIRGTESFTRLGQGSNYNIGKEPLGSIGAMRFFCSDGKSVLKVGSDTTPTHSKSNLEIHEVLLGYKELTSDEIATVKRELTKENSIKVTEELLRTLPGDPTIFKLVHESRPLSKIQLEVEGVKSYSSAVEALDSLKIRPKTSNHKSRIWRGGRWSGVCIGLLNLGGGILKHHEFSIVSFGSYFEKLPPLAILPYEGFIQTGIPQIHQNKIVSTCDMTNPPSFGLKYPGFSAAFLCPNGTHIERIGYSTFENNSKQGFEILKNGTLSLPHAYKEKKHVGPLGQITAIQLFCSDGISTVTIGQPSKSTSISKPGEIGTVKVGYVKHNSSLLDKNTSMTSLLMPASFELISKDKKRRLLKHSNPNFPEYTQKVTTWEGEDLIAVCVDFAVIDDTKRSSRNSNYLRWAGNTIRYPEKHLIMSIGFAFKRKIMRNKSTGTAIPQKKIKIAENIPKVKLQSEKSIKNSTRKRKKFN
ncbi:uncharacterized protein cubi_02668 [Cryptosporidium ubiquitum]|uniref:Uncharacterized protein n=1 Tax=Cryptosporidium ubiquitum TaxID=857276 RepID=A0A1J4MGX4_9CRYT|nr:uncharacterized protein cubi_02668 [Cryptosporidium ubiquitum]OII73456.1 hypothetical protein cubi_02668 [Cryptosporidium ubiquitum]